MSLLTDHIYKIDALYDKGVKVTDNLFQMPILKSVSFTPTRIVGSNYLKIKSDKEKYNFGIHFFLDDNLLERFWSAPARYTNLLKKYECMFTPDYSLYTDMPLPMQIWNTYRNRFLGAYYQSEGITVIPTVSWSTKESYDFCFSGLPKGSTLAISTIGSRTNKETIALWKDGVSELIKRTKPTSLLIYGPKIDFNFGDIKVKFFENEIIKHLEKVTKINREKKREERKAKEAAKKEDRDKKNNEIEHEKKEVA